MDGANVGVRLCDARYSSNCSNLVPARKSSSIVRERTRYATDKLMKILKISGEVKIRR